MLLLLFVAYFSTPDWLPKGLIVEDALSLKLPRM